eukprot:TRINITY_DN11822_c0_g1_i1.p1 TRINITY_DN11822_c0_g1~~TRINITY_DN11822_c0_g1_i1.p1  ORF type:complete len:126 (+),score=12.51 TRINITY_DN11822_c0_g1_i1:25-402(+)
MSMSIRAVCRKISGRREKSLIEMSLSEVVDMREEDQRLYLKTVTSSIPVVRPVKKLKTKKASKRVARKLKDGENRCMKCRKGFEPIDCDGPEACDCSPNVECVICKKQKMCRSCYCDRLIKRNLF